MIPGVFQFSKVIFNEKPIAVQELFNCKIWTLGRVDN